MSQLEEKLKLVSNADYMTELLQQAANPEPLHDELQMYMDTPKKGGRDWGWGWVCIRHPLVFAVPYMPMCNATYNKQFKYKTEALEEARNRNNWHSYVYLHERPYRFDAFVEIMRYLNGEEYWELLSSVWSDSENLWQVGGRDSARALRHPAEGKEKFMDEREKELLDELPDRIRVFRGCTKRNRNGFSWTLSYTKAVWFSTRLGEKDPRIIQGFVDKTDVVGLLLGRNEIEIVVAPEQVSERQPVRKIRRAPKWQRLQKRMAQHTALQGRTDHGADHWDRVEANAIALHPHVPGSDLLVARLFAIIHDSCRVNENHDPRHGHRSAALATKMYQAGEMEELSIERFEKLRFACYHHNGHGPVEDPTIGLCFDADRLDLIRVGIMPDPKLLSTEAARQRICAI